MSHDYKRFIISSELKTTLTFIDESLIKKHFDQYYIIQNARGFEGMVRKSSPKSA